MGFEGLLGNDRLKQNLSSALSRGRISHFYLITGPKGSGKHTLARLLAAAILCTRENKPCLGCNACRKVLGGGHPDFITIDDPEKKTVPVDLIRDARSDMFIRPNEGSHKIYLFPRAHDMAVPGQNALLKILEEPPAYGVYILLAENAQVLLPTVRSRCTELAMTALHREQLLSALQGHFPQATREQLEAAAGRSGGWLGQAIRLLEESSDSPQLLEFARCYREKDNLGLTRLLVGMEKWKRETLGEILQSWLALTEEALADRSGIAAVSPLARNLNRSRTAAELFEINRCLRKAADYTLSNVSPAAVCGWLVWQLR